MDFILSLIKDFFMKNMNKGERVYCAVFFYPFYLNLEVICWLIGKEKDLDLLYENFLYTLYFMFLDNSKLK